MLELYRSAISLRRSWPGLAEQPLTWYDEVPDGVLAFDRGDGFRCVVNFTDRPVPLPPHTEVALASGPLEGDARDQLPGNTAVWLRLT